MTTPPMDNTKRTQIGRTDIPKVGAIQVATVIRCPACRSTRVNCEGRKPGLRYYRCLVCVDPDTGSWSTFRVQVVDPGA